MTTVLWKFRSRRSDFEKVTSLWLYPELDCSSCLDDCESEDGAEQLAYYCHYLQRDERCRVWWGADAVPIYWSVQGDNVAEPAPCKANMVNSERTFLTSYTAPINAKSGVALNWFQLPVLMDRFPNFSKALGWKPSPFLTHAPLRSIVAGIEQRSP